MKKLIFCFLFSILLLTAPVFTQNESYGRTNPYGQNEQSHAPKTKGYMGPTQEDTGNNGKEGNLHHTPWQLIIYRPENSFHINDVRCYLKIEDTKGNDVTYTAATATYEWASIPGTMFFYQKSFYLSGGMAMHLQLKPGNYKITFYTPPEKQNKVKTENSGTWNSNTFDYSTDNPAKVLFVVPVTNDNGFYNGSWYIDYKAPEWFKFTKPKH